MPTIQIDGYKVTTVKGESITIECEKDRYNKDIKGYEKKQFKIAFKIGDMAEYDSFNLSYFGPIVSITDKTVTIREQYRTNPKNHRLNLSKFAWRNYNFNAETKAAENSETMNYI